MSGKLSGNDEMSPQSLAFEYVSGTLRGEERRTFESSLREDEALQREVKFWEEQLMALQPDEERSPKPDTWSKISQTINPETARHEEKARFNWVNFWQWGAPTFAAVALMFVLFGYYPKVNTVTPNTDYVAVLTGEDGKAILTALSTQDAKKMWLKWELESLSPDTHAQLWAVSKRDGETRPITVFENTGTAYIPLDEASWRLVTDADFLILTEEEPGGSAIDEPSDILIAKGVCVRFSQQTTI